MPALDPVVRFRKFIVVDPVTGCHNWTGAKNKLGYGAFGYNGRPWPAHRFAWLITFGPIPIGILVHHKCRNPSCCNVNHLQLVTPWEHMLLTPNSPSHKEFYKTRCDKGHLLLDPNLYYSPNGKHKECLTCRRERTQKHNLKKALSKGRMPGIANFKKTHCIRGHLFGGDNLHFDPKGRRVCKACDRIRRKLVRQRKKELV